MNRHFCLWKGSLTQKWNCPIHSIHLVQTAWCSFLCETKHMFWRTLGAKQHPMTFIAWTKRDIYRLETFINISLCTYTGLSDMRVSIFLGERVLLLGQHINAISRERNGGRGIKRLPQRKLYENHNTVEAELSLVSRTDLMRRGGESRSHHHWPLIRVQQRQQDQTPARRSRGQRAPARPAHHHRLCSITASV